MDTETGQGLMTDVCLKRKIRDYVSMVKEDEPGYEIYVRNGAVLNAENRRAYKAADLKPESKKLPKNEQDAKDVTAWMNTNFFDIRTFGAVMTTEVNTGQVRGPIQINFSRSIDPVEISEHSITRKAITKEDEDKQGTMGRKYTIPYGLYRCHGYVSAKFAQRSGFSEEDLDLVFNALMNMFDHDRSAARGEMSACALYVFKHDNELGNAPARKLFETIDIKKVSEGPARCYQDYSVTVNEKAIPESVSLIRYLD